MSTSTGIDQLLVRDLESCHLSLNIQIFFFFPEENLKFCDVNHTYNVPHSLFSVFPEKAETLSEEHRQEMLQKMIDLRWNPITGTASKWDYEKNDWKK